MDFSRHCSRTACGRHFPFLDPKAHLCTQCAKIEALPSEEREKGDQSFLIAAIKNTPECMWCSGLYFGLQGEICGACNYKLTKNIEAPYTGETLPQFLSSHIPLSQPLRMHPNFLRDNSNRNHLPPPVSFSALSHTQPVPSPKELQSPIHLQKPRSIFTLAQTIAESSAADRIGNSVKYSGPIPANCLSDASKSRGGGPIRRKGAQVSGRAGRFPPDNPEVCISMAGAFIPDAPNAGPKKLQRLTPAREVFDANASASSSVAFLLRQFRESYYDEYNGSYGDIPASIFDDGLRIQVTVGRGFADIRKEWLHGSLRTFRSRLLAAHYWEHKDHRKYLNLRVVFKHTPEQDTAGSDFDPSSGDDNGKDEPAFTPFPDACSPAIAVDAPGPSSVLDIPSPSTVFSPPAAHLAYEPLFLTPVIKAATPIDASQASVLVPLDATPSAAPTVKPAPASAPHEPNPESTAVSESAQKTSPPRSGFRAKIGQITTPEIMLRCTIASVTDCVVDGTGTPQLRKTLYDITQPKELFISHTWVTDRDQGIPHHAGGGYIGRGFYKQCIAGSDEDGDLALFQCNPRIDGIPVDESRNLSILTSDLVAGARVKFFHTGFTKRAEYYGYGMPNYLWVEVGRLITLTPESASEAGLQYRTLPATRRIPITSRNYDTEYKFSGNLGPCLNGDYQDMDDALNAFMHYMVEETNGQMVFADMQGIRRHHLQGWTLFDPQYHTPLRQAAGLFDHGQAGIDAFKKLHDCSNNRACKELRLPDVKRAFVPTRPKPRKAQQSGQRRSLTPPSTPTWPLRHSFSDTSSHGSKDLQGVIDSFDADQLDSGI